ncbi:MAG: hypothetical protein ABIF87_13880 [Pseudomonadota bacterium]
MLFPYKYVPHTIEKLQEYINHLFLKVWCEADGEYDIEKLHPELREIVLAIYYDDSIEKDHLYGPIKEIYDLFLKIKKGRREALKKWYVNNNSIEDLCGNNNNCKPLQYKRLKQLYAELAPKIEAFFKSLFTEVIKLKAVCSRIGKIDEHYKAFMTENDEGKCPFCGINDVKGPYHTKRDAYDHYLPKNIYPFNSINFKNLAPMCHECNSSYKTVKDPLYKPNHRDPLHTNSNNRRKAFYPYAEEQPEIIIEIEIGNKDINNISPDDIHLKISSTKHADEIETWKDIFGIEERYKAKCCGKNDGKVWYQMIDDEFENAKTLSDAVSEPADLYQMTIRQASKYPYADANILKKPFLEACKKAGYF